MQSNINKHFNNDRKRSFVNFFSIDRESLNQRTKERKLRKLDINKCIPEDQNNNETAKVKNEKKDVEDQINCYLSYSSRFRQNGTSDIIYLQLEDKIDYYFPEQPSSKNCANVDFDKRNFGVISGNRMEMYNLFTTQNMGLLENIQPYQRKVFPYVYPNTILPLQNELIMFMSSCILKERINWFIDSLKKKYSFLKNNSRYLIYYPFSSNEILNYLSPSIEQPISALIPSSMNSSIFVHPTKFGWIPSCTKCLLPGFHPKTAWLLPPSFFGRGGRLKRKIGFLKGLPVSLFTTCFLVKNILTVESTHLFVSTARKEEYEYIKKGVISLKEEGYKESIYYLEDNHLDNEIRSRYVNDNNLEPKVCRDKLISNQYNTLFVQNALFCGFVSIDAKICGNTVNERIYQDFRNRNLTSNYNIDNIKINPILYSNIFTVSHVDEKKFPNDISDCDILLERSNSNEFYSGKKRNISCEQKIPLLIPRLRCIIRPSKYINSCYTLNKPCYLLLWSYNIRNCNNTIKDINWINIQCKFAPLKYFGDAYETSVFINLKPHQEVVLDQLNRIRNIDEARIFAWILAGCMQYTINELLIDSFTRSLYFGDQNFDIQNHITIFNHCISNGPFTGFPESPLDHNGNVKWQILHELLDK